MLFYCRDVFRRRSPAVAVRAAAAVQQPAATQQLTACNKVETRWTNASVVGFVISSFLTALNKVEIRWKNDDIFVGFQKGRSGPEKRRFWHRFVL